MFLVINKRTILITLGVLIFIPICLLGISQYHKDTPALADAKTVIIDAGHGGFDGGAVADNGVVEKDINLSIAKKLETILLKQGIAVIMTRSDDVALASSKAEDTRARVQLMKTHPEAIYVSVHCNKFGQSQYKGLQTFYSQNAKEGKLLGECIQGAVKDLQPENKRESKVADRSIYILKHAPICATIVECGFLSNSEDLKNLQDPLYQDNIADVISKGINNFYSQLEKSKLPAVPEQPNIQE
ncbi:MAG: N-acetylmuramoyl-L-alanine amidase [Bacillota bacterium]|nr:N-acetylmuramoyl-L-alanine amidase [Bacillota bacterium]